jgi:hypothetical protein
MAFPQGLLTLLAADEGDALFAAAFDALSQPTGMGATGAAPSADGSVGLCTMWDAECRRLLAQSLRSRRDAFSAAVDAGKFVLSSG